MNLFIIDHPYHYEAENLCRVFFPFDRVVVLHGEEEEFEPQSRTVWTEITDGEKPYRVKIEDEAGTTELFGEKCAEDDTLVRIQS